VSAVLICPSTLTQSRSQELAMWRKEGHGNQSSLLSKYDRGSYGTSAEPKGIQNPNAQQLHDGRYFCGCPPRLCSGATIRLSDTETCLPKFVWSEKRLNRHVCGEMNHMMHSYMTWRWFGMSSLSRSIFNPEQANQFRRKKSICLHRKPTQAT
jgi:hypothetical protein